MEMELRRLTWKTCLVYLDDIMVMGKTFEEHLTNLEEVFSRMKEANLKLNPKKLPPLPKRSRISGAYYFGKRDQHYGNEDQCNSRLGNTKR